MSGWEERLATFEADFTRELPSEACARFAAAVADYLKGQVRRSSDPPEEAFQAALDGLVEMIEGREFNRAFCARVKAARKAAGKRRAEIARALGIKVETYRRYETGVPLPQWHMEAFAALTGTTIEALLTEPTEGRVIAFPASDVV